MQISFSTLSAAVTATNDLIGRCIAWLTGLMALVVFIIVVLRAFFNIGSIALQESVSYMHASVFLLCLAYTAQCGGHVRVDIFYRRFSTRTKAWVDACGAILFLLPFSVFLSALSWQFARESWHIMEQSINAGGIPAVYLLKSMIPLAGILLAFRAVAEVIDQALLLVQPPTPKQ